MLVLRCTKKLLTRLHAPPSDPADESTTLLGDWYATILHVRPVQLVLLVNERSRLPVFLPARELVTLHQRVPEAIARALRHIGVPADIVDKELSRMEPVAIAPTLSRSVLGTMNQVIFELDFRMEPGETPDLDALNQMLGHSLLIPKVAEYPAEAARRLLGVPPVPRIKRVVH